MEILEGGRAGKPSLGLQLPSLAAAEVERYIEPPYQRSDRVSGLVELASRAGGRLPVDAGSRAARGRCVGVVTGTTVAWVRGG